MRLNPSNNILSEGECKIKQMSVIFAGYSFGLNLPEGLLIKGNLSLIPELILRILIPKPDKDNMIPSPINEHVPNKTIVLKLYILGVIKDDPLTVPNPVLAIVYLDDILGLHLSLDRGYVRSLGLQLFLCPELGLFLLQVVQLGQLTDSTLEELLVVLEQLADLLLFALL